MEPPSIATAFVDGEESSRTDDLEAYSRAAATVTDVRRAEIDACDVPIGGRIARALAYVEGNKRTALLAAFVVLYQNGVHLVADEADAVRTLQALDTGAGTEEEFANWIMVNVHPLWRRS